MNYNEQAQQFAQKTGTKLTVIGQPEYKRHFQDDDHKRYVFKLRLTRNRKSYTFSFGQSLREGSNEPNMYDVLTCLTKYDPDTFENFCDEFGYNADSRKAERTYKAVCKEWAAVQRLFSDCLDELAEIN